MTPREGPARHRRLLLGALASLWAATPSPARAQAAVASSAVASWAAAPPACAARGEATSAAGRRWPAPLDRAVTLHAPDLSLRDALGRLAAAARLRLSYSGDLLPLERRVCVAWDDVAAGDALAALLGESAVAPVLTGGDQVVLAPAPAPVTRGSARGAAPAPPVGVLERVVVTGTAGAAERSRVVAAGTVRGRSVAQRDAASLARALDGVVPGVWVWEQSPSNLLARYGSFRGASSFGVSAPKVYVDGVEVANPLLVTQLDPATIDRVEVIRGPQGAALYGANAISGVVDIHTRPEAVGDATGGARLRTQAGVSQTEFAAHPAFVQEHALSLGTGAGPRSAGLALSVGTVGAYVPAAYDHEVKASAGLRLLGARSTLAVTARFYGQQAGTAANPLIGALPPPTPAPAPPAAGAGPTSRHGEAGSHDGRRSGHASLAPPIAVLPPAADSAPQSVRQYTVATTATFAASERWTHAVTAGVDGYRLADVPNESTPLPSAADSALRAARGGADRATLRASSVARIGTSDRASATLTLAAEHSVLRARFDGEPVAGAPARGIATPGQVTWRSTTGLVAQTSVALGDALFVDGGLRLEHDAGYPVRGGIETLPMLGAAVVRDAGPMTAKLRAAYGRGLRLPEATPAHAGLLGARSAAAGLAPEMQSGIEGGADLVVGGALGFHVTRFDQRAFDLVQSVASVADTLLAPRTMRHRVLFRPQNVGEIANRGWEMQTSLSAGALSLAGTLSLVDSRVRRLAPGYTGDLRPGDRMLAVPARTLSLTAAWTGAAWSTSWTLARASDWTNYDRVALARVYASGDQAVLAGPRLRAYWRDYAGITHLRATASRDLVHGLALVVTGENLLDVQRGEPDDATVLPGRTAMVGVKARF